MNSKDVVDIIASLGFPIFICLVLLWFIKSALMQQQKLLDEMSKNIALNTEVIRNLTENLRSK